MMDRELFRQALAALEANRRTHYYCEDSWYSCPKHEDGCANEAEGNECNCGADKANAEIDYVTAAIKEALAQPEKEPMKHGGRPMTLRECMEAEEPAQPEQEPVAWMYEWDGKKHLTFTDQRFVEEAHPHFNKSTPLYTTPPQRKPLSSEDIEQCCYEADSVADDHCQTWKWTQAFARAIEAKLREKNT